MRPHLTREGVNNVFDDKAFVNAVRETGYTMSSFAKKLGIDVATLYRKRRRGGDFTRKELKIIKKSLELTKNRFFSIFFV